MTHSDPEKDRQDMLGRLIRHAGPRLQPSAALETRVRTAVFEEWQRGLQRTRRRKVAFGLAAAAVAVFSITIGWRSLAPSSATLEVASVEFSKGDTRVDSNGLRANEVKSLHVGEKLSTGRDGGARLILSSAVSIRVAPNTEVRWTDSKELELLNGSIYVDSGPKHAPLTIATRFGKVSHLGTRYRIRETSESLTVGVRNGRVEVTNAAGKSTAESGQQFKLGKNGQITREFLPLFGEEWAWVDALAPTFNIESRSLKDLLTWATSESGRILEFADASTEAAAAATTLHGTSDSFAPLEAVEAILPTTDFVSRYDGERLIVSRR